MRVWEHRVTPLKQWSLAQMLCWSTRRLQSLRIPAGWEKRSRKRLKLGVRLTRWDYLIRNQKPLQRVHLVHFLRILRESTGSQKPQRLVSSKIPSSQEDNCNRQSRNGCFICDSARKDRWPRWRKRKRENYGWIGHFETRAGHIWKYSFPWAGDY